MKRVSFTLVYILLISIATSISSVQETRNSASVAISQQENNELPTKQSTLPIILSSEPVNVLPEPATFSLFGFGLLAIVGFGWIKRTSEHD